jgi:DNA-binding transcriptional LysR family regulator
MSGMLQRLRYQLDDEILVRDGPSMELTYYGTTLLPAVLLALDEIEDLTRAEVAFDPARSARTFTLMMGDYCSAMLAPRLLARLSSSAPHVRLDIQSLSNPLARLTSGDLDLCITTRERFKLDAISGGESLESTHLFADRFVCVVGDQHPLKRTPSMSDYLAFPQVGLKFSGNLTTIAERAMRKSIPDYQFTFTVAESTLIPEIVEASNTIGLMPLKLVRRAAQRTNIRYFDPPFSIPSIDETLLWHPRHAMEASHAWIRGIITEEAASLPIEA